MEIANKRILLSPNDVGGHLWGLHTGLERNGIASDVVYLNKANFAFQYTHDYSMYDLGPIRKKAAKAIKAAQLSLKYDIYHFNNATSLLPGFIDLSVLKLRKKRIFVTFNGTLTRLKSHCLQNYRFSQFGIDGNEWDYYMWPIRDQRKRRIIRTWQHFARQIFCLNPDLCNTAEGSVFVPYAKGSFYEIQRAKRYSIGKSIRIAHATNNPLAKGTSFFKKAIDAVRSHYPNVVVDYIEKVDNKTALARIAECDVLFDQVLLGWYGGVAVEAMQLGKPVITYIREGDLRHIPADMRRDLPVINANPDTIEEVLRDIAENPGKLKELSEKSVYYVNQYHDPQKVARMVAGYYAA